MMFNNENDAWNERCSNVSNNDDTTMRTTLREESSLVVRQCQYPQNTGESRKDEDNDDMHKLLWEELEEIKAQDQYLQSLQEIPGNDNCADCGSSDPKWASITFGILICAQCSGVHR